MACSDTALMIASDATDSSESDSPPPGGTTKTTPIQAEKKRFRREILRRRAALSEAARQAASARICARLTTLPAFRQAASVAAFFPMPEEVDILPVLSLCWREGKLLALPRVASAEQRKITFHRVRRRAELLAGYQGIFEPKSDAKNISLNNLDFLIVPAVAVDKKNRRMGYGGGFYDTFLASRKNCPACAVVFSCQHVDTLPYEQHDQYVDLIITDDE